MNEAEWLASKDPRAMLHCLEVQSVPGHVDGLITRPSDRKLRLWVEACRNATARGGSWANKLGEGSDLQSAVYEWSRTHGVSWKEEVPNSARTALLRETVGNPFRPVRLVPAWFTPQVVSLGQAAYDERGTPCPGHSGMECCQTSLCPVCLDGAGRIEDGTLDAAILAVLSDALEEAGCPQTEPCGDCTEGVIRTRLGYRDCERCKGSGVVPNHVLAHLRSPGPHVRGCHVLDLIVGRS